MLEDRAAHCLPDRTGEAYTQKHSRALEPVCNDSARVGKPRLNPPTSIFTSQVRSADLPRFAQFSIAVAVTLDLDLAKSNCMSRRLTCTASKAGREAPLCSLMKLQEIFNHAWPRFAAFKVERAPALRSKPKCTCKTMFFNSLC